MPSPVPAKNEAEVTRERWFRSPLCLAAVSGVLLWASFPPLDWWPLAWIAPLGWLLLIRRSPWPRHGHLQVWLAAFGQWLLMLEGLRLAHPALYLGWIALAGYMAVYIVVFVAVARVAVHQSRTPLAIAAPIVWTAFELVRGHALTGFSMALLGHTQVRWTALIQIADVFGAYGVSFLVVFVAACVTTGSTTLQRRAARRWSAMLPVGLAAAAVAAALGYGSWAIGRSAGDGNADESRHLRVALIQASFDTIFESNPERDATVFARYRELSVEAFRDEPRLDLIVWPESMFTGTLGELVVEGQPTPPPDIAMDRESYTRLAADAAAAFQKKARNTARRFNRPSDDEDNPSGPFLLVGADSQHLGPNSVRRYNAALLIAPTGEVAGRYFKMHRVPFGEFIPFGDTVPWLYTITPMTQGLTPGPRPQAFRVAGAVIAPSICFESTVPHLMRRQVATLENAGAAPDLLVNVTNDGWFWGSAILDYHLACGVFRAVENRLPLLVAANTGISAYIDPTGRIMQQGPRRGEDALLVDVRLGGLTSWYRKHGDVFAAACLAVGAVWTVMGLARRRRRGKRVE